ncbi:hypothetical protein STTU_3688 [Streptomyces sp. Tu6071]|nr:hypothetical protein STTU_3688 [Streptomyces sp. Tu6071]
MNPTRTSGLNDAPAGHRPSFRTRCDSGPKLSAFRPTVPGVARRRSASAGRGPHTYRPRT